MAFIVTDTAFNINNLNLSFYNSNIISSKTELGANTSFNTNDIIDFGTGDHRLSGSI